ncbi:unnamed protein product [Merluccius merluccius]
MSVFNVHKTLQHSKSPAEMEKIAKLLGFSPVDIDMIVQQWLTIHLKKWDEVQNTLGFWSEDKATLRQWVHFVRVRRAHFPMTSVTASTRICSAHFKEDYDEGDASMVSLGLKTERLAKLIPTTVCAQHLSACPATAPLRLPGYSTSLPARLQHREAPGQQRCYVMISLTLEKHIP